MSLLKLSTEILLQIFSYDCLRRCDLHHTILTCWRLYDIGLPCLYRDVCISARPNHIIPGKHLTSVERFFATSALYPTHLSLVHTAEFYWETDCPGRRIRLFSLLSRFSSIKTLSIACAYPGYSTDILLRHTTAFKSPTTLCHIKLTASSSRWARVSPKELATIFFSISNLETFTLEQFDFDNFSGDSSNFSYPPTKLTRLEFLKSKSAPKGSLVRSLLADHPALRTLIWTVETEGISLPWSSTSVDEILSPLKPHLIDLRLTLKGCLNLRRQQLRRHNGQLDYSGFAMLKNLEIHEWLSFTQIKVPRPFHNPFLWKYNRGDLYQRLPISLETLTIYFDPGSYILKNRLRDKTEDYAWILALANHKGTSLQRLSRVSLLERVDWKYQDRDTHPPHVAARECDYPWEAIEVFRKAGIQLRVLLRPRPRVFR